jgi:hypothetical protein
LAVVVCTCSSQIKTIVVTGTNTCGERETIKVGFAYTALFCGMALTPNIEKFVLYLPSNRLILVSFAQENISSLTKYINALTSFCAREFYRMLML